MLPVNLRCVIKVYITFKWSEKLQLGNKIIINPSYSPLSVCMFVQTATWWRQLSHVTGYPDELFPDIKLHLFCFFFLISCNLCILCTWGQSGLTEVKYFSHTTHCFWFLWPLGFIKEPSVLFGARLRIPPVWSLKSWLNSGLYLRGNIKFRTKITFFLSEVVV